MFHGNCVNNLDKCPICRTELTSDDDSGNDSDNDYDDSDNSDNSDDDSY
jgi:hypothetical protein